MKRSHQKLYEQHDMKIQTNLSPNNSWIVTYGAIDTDKYYPVTINSGLMFTFLFCYSFYMSPM